MFLSEDKLKKALFVITSASDRSVPRPVPLVAMLIPKAHKVTVYSKLFNGEARIHIGTPVHSAVSKPALFCALATLPCPENTFCRRLAVAHTGSALAGWVQGERGAKNICTRVTYAAGHCSKMGLDASVRLPRCHHTDQGSVKCS